MRAFVPEYNLITPASLDQALELLAQGPGRWKAFAGGTDLMVLLEAGKLPHRNYVNISSLSELRGVNVMDEWVQVGGLATYSEIQAHRLLADEFPLLCQAASETGGLAIQNRGTIGGNIVNASPAADSPPALLAYDAQLELLSVRGKRNVPYSQFHLGYKRIDLRDDELLASVHLPRSGQKLAQYYKKVGTRRAQAISKVCLAAVAAVTKGAIVQVRIAIGSVAPIPLRCIATEELLRGKQLDLALMESAKAELGQEIMPITDVRSTKEYRLRVTQNLLEEFLRGLINGAAG
ncbi:MAG TPA: xanthine dehydrogenase family protein subunit M [Pyrinomonadaceae bacterium]|nr:xanthine dehydrogenase family protein subunit M [Pyrinomonadaceae bacterium]